VKSESRGVLLLGMHRSGTSVATRLLVKLGLEPPPDEDLMEADSDNALGYWESKRLTKLNDDILAVLGTSWYAPPSISEISSWLPELQDRRAEAESVARAVLRGEWVWKDPRLCLLLPFWDDLLGRQHPLIVVHREPRDTVDSLVRRDGFSIPHALALWERHTLGVLRAASGRPLHVESYEDLLADPRGWSERVAAFLVRCGLIANQDQRLGLNFSDDLLRPRSRPDATAAIDLNARQTDLQEHLKVLSQRSWESFDEPVVATESEEGIALLEAHQEIWRGRRRLDDTISEAAAHRAALEVSRADEAVRHELTLARATALEAELSHAKVSAAQQLEQVRGELSASLERERLLCERLARLEASLTFRTTAPVRRVYASMRGRAAGQPS
jgi:hypothetical protein